MDFPIVILVGEEKMMTFSTGVHFLQILLDVIFSQNIIVITALEQLIITKFYFQSSSFALYCESVQISKSNQQRFHDQTSKRQRK